MVTKTIISITKIIPTNRIGLLTMPDGFSSISSNWIVSVSYTHLDVYKRQVLFSSTKNFFNPALINLFVI